MKSSHAVAAIAGVLLVLAPAASGDLLDQPPAPTITNAPAGATNQTSATFEFTDSDAAATFECQLDNGGFAACTSGVGYNGLPDGPHSFEVRAVDPAFTDPSDPASHSWTIDTTPPDTTPPDTTITSAAPDPSSRSGSFSFTGDDQGGSGVTGFQCRLDSSDPNAFASCTSPAPYSGLGDGSHTFEVRAVDAENNVDPTPASVTWTIDATPPDTSITSSSTAATSRSASFSFTGNDGAGSGVAGFECRLSPDQAAFSACGSPKAYSGLADGSHTFAVRAVDGVGNVDSTPDTVTWTIDTTPPVEPTIDTGPPNPSGSNQATFTFHGDGDANASLQCRLDGATFASCSSPKTYDNLSDGTHTFDLREVDQFGNTSSTASHAWTIDTVHPLVTLTDKPPLVTNRTTASFSFTADHPGSSFECRLDSANDADFAPCTSPQLFNSLLDGPHTFAVRAVSLGNVGIATEYTWTVDTVPPQTTIASGPPAQSNTATANFTFASNEPGATFACSIDSTGYTPCTSPKSYANLIDGAHTFHVEAVDAAGNSDASPAAYSWQIQGGHGTADTIAPGEVKKLRRNVGYGRLQLRWKNPANSDFDHVEIYVSTSAKSAPRTLVYRGKGHTYTNKRFKNGLYYRYRISTLDHLRNASKGANTTIRPSVLLKSPRAGRVVHRPPLLRWTAVRRATFYNVQVWRKSSKLLSAWPVKARRALAHRWTFGGRRVTLGRGLYVWYVWPAFGTRANPRYGQLLGEGTFRVR